jgi:hypothetical protein
MPTCQQCGKRYSLGFFASLSGRNWINCPECQKENYDIRRTAGLQEEGRIRARENFKEQKQAQAKRNKWRRDFLNRSPFG